MIPDIYLIDINKNMIAAWKDAFNKKDNITITHKDFKSFMDEHKEIQGVVSPANSFGIMDGGYDAAITAYFDKALYEAVQTKLLQEYMGEQPVGTCMLVKIPESDKILLHVPSMRMPSIILDPLVIYSCMRSTLVTAIKHDINSLVIPAFGGLTGQVPVELIAMLMKKAYDDVIDREKNIRSNTWGNVNRLF